MSTRKQTSKSYKIHDNGGRPFTVLIKGKNIEVIQHKHRFERNKSGKFVDIEEPPKEVLSVKAEKAFIGKKSPTGGYDGLTLKEAEGNTILLKVGPKYIYIGSEIFEFTPMPNDEIQEYYSDIGNNDVPYPYAVGKTHIYIMLNHVAVEKSYFDMKKDIYEQFYFNTWVLDCKGVTNFKINPHCKSIVENPKETSIKLQDLKRKTHKLKDKIKIKRSF